MTFGLAGLGVDNDVCSGANPPAETGVRRERGVARYNNLSPQLPLTGYVEEHSRVALEVMQTHTVLEAASRTAPGADSVRNSSGPLVPTTLSGHEMAAAVGAAAVRE